MVLKTPNSHGELRKALDRLEQEIIGGLEHGFFECQVSCQLVKDRKRQLTIKAGKSHHFVIPEDELHK